MEFILLLIVALCGYGAYRAIKGGFERPQSERLNVYGVIGIIVAALIVWALLDKWFG